MTSSAVQRRIGWIGLTLIGAFLLFASINDMLSDHANGLPSDHSGAFANVAGSAFSTVKNSAPGTAHYITTLEYGYALHELTFGLLFLLLVLIPFRRGERWAWFACWAVLIATIGYSLTIAAHDHTLLVRSLIADIGVPVFLLVSARAFFTRSEAAPGPAERETARVEG